MSLRRDAETPVVEVRVRTGDASYPVVVAPGLRRRLPDILTTYAQAHRYAVVADSNVAPLYGEEAVALCRAQGLAADLFVFPAGEANKTREQWSALTDGLLEAGVGRDGVVVALGGGVTGDLAGFVAATFLRGIPLVQVPTSLVAMVDASVGGKTGVDVAAGKNLVGAFHAPRVVVVDPEAVATLPVNERAEGLAEAVKHGAIADAAYLDALADASDALLAGEPQATLDAVVRSVHIKAAVVSADEREAGVRQILNFGHTYGHALEAASGYAAGHGTCVAAGMVLEARLGERLGVTAPGTSRRLEEVLARFGLGRLPVGAEDTEGVFRRLPSDKKARAGRVRFVLLREMGTTAEGEGWSCAVPEKLARAVLEEATAAK